MIRLEMIKTEYSNSSKNNAQKNENDDRPYDGKENVII